MLLIVSLNSNAYYALVILDKFYVEYIFASQFSLNLIHIMNTEFTSITKIYKKYITNSINKKYDNKYYIINVTSEIHKVSPSKVPNKQSKNKNHKDPPYLKTQTKKQTMSKLKLKEFA